MAQVPFDFSKADVAEVGGLSAFAMSGKPLHWNVSVPGDWQGLYSLNDLGSYVSSFCEDKPGVYRLIGLDDSGKPAELDRLCGRDTTGTLYIGKEGKTFSNRSRLGRLVRSLRSPSTWGYNQEHAAGYRLRRHPELTALFPPNKVALTWCYCRTPRSAECALFEAYFESDRAHAELPR